MIKALGEERTEGIVRQRSPLAGRLPAEDRQRLQTFWKALEEAMPGVMPPASPVSSNAVEGHVRAITAELKRLP